MGSKNSERLSVEKAISDRLYLTVEKDTYVKYCPGYKFNSHKKVVEFARNHSFLKEVIAITSEYRQPFVRRMIAMIYIELKNCGEVSRPKCHARTYTSAIKDKLFDKTIRKRIIEKQLPSFDIVPDWSNIDYKIRSYLVKIGNPGNRKYSASEKESAISFLAHHRNQWQRLNYREVRDLLTRNGYNMSLSTLKLWDRTHNNNEINNRNGRSVFDRTVRPPFKFTKPNYVNEEWQIDGFRVNKPFTFHDGNNNRKNAFLTCILIVDTFSKSPVGFSIGAVENHKLVIDAIENAVFLNGVLPRKMLGDRSSAFKHPEFKNLSNKIEKLGCLFKKVPTPESKGVIESLINVIQANFIKHVPGSLGLGIKTRKLDSRLSDEEAYRTFLVPQQWSENETKLAIVDCIEIYKFYKGLNGVSPFDIFNGTNKINPASDLTAQIPFLFWPSKEITVTRSQVSFYLNRQEYTFTIDDETLWKPLTGQKVLVRFSPKDLSKVYIYDHNDGFKCTASRDIEIAKELVERGSSLENVPLDQVEFYRDRKNKISNFYRIHKKRLSENEEKLKLTFGEEALQTNYLNGDKELTTKVKDSEQRRYYMERFGLTSEDERLLSAEDNPKIIPIESNVELEQVTIPDKDESGIKKLDRWDFS